jgi:small-conductance mechanosensitive channel
LGIKASMNRSKKLIRAGEGSKHAIYQIIRYFVWITALIIGLESLGVKVNILLASSAALLVGLGLGLQQTFGDMVAGLILLIEGTVRVGDILDIEGSVVQVREMGLRTSKVINRDNIIIIMPNSKMVNDKVVNWSHQVKDTRFRIKVGVAYGSDVDLVIRLLEESASEHPLNMKDTVPVGRLVDFGESSLDFELLFYSSELFRIEQVTSDMRRTIDRKFRQHHVTIPFPQRDLHLKSGLPAWPGS